MQIFIDSANVAQIKEAWEMGIISGVTTNPSLIAREGVRLETRIKEILEIVKAGPVNVEAIGKTARQLVADAKILAAWSPQVVVKIPMNNEGLKAIKELRSLGIKTNATLVFSASQCILAAQAGANYISPFLGRLEDQGESPSQLLTDIKAIWRMHNIDTKIIAASIRKPEHAVLSAVLGAHIATIPYPVLSDMLRHPLTDAGIKRFEADWEKANLI
jgi:transaldolase